MLNRFKYQNLPMFAVAGGGAGGGGSFEQIETPLDQLGDDSDAGNGNQNQNGDNLSVEEEDVLASLWGSPDDPADDDDSDPDEPELNADGTPKKPVKKAKKAGATDDDDSGENPNAAAIAAQLGRDLQAISVPADFLPADFDPANREHVSAAFTKAQQQGAGATLRLFFPILDRALKAQRASILSEVGNQLNTNTSESRINAMLEASIPEATDPGLGPVVKTLFKQARARHEGKPALAIAATKKALAAIGVKLGGNPDAPPAGVQRQQRVGAGGAAHTLDQFFQMPTQQGNAAARRMRSR